MSKSIGGAHYDIVADTSKFQKGMVATRKELRDAKKAFMDTRTPIERLGLDLDDLGKLYRKGAIDANTYERKAKMLTKAFREQNPVVTRATIAQDKLNKEVEEYARAQNAATSATRKRMSLRSSGVSGGTGLPIGRLAGVAAVGAGLFKVKNLAGESVNEFARFEQAGRDFQVLTGSVAEGNKVMSEFRSLAKETPLGINQITKAAQTLLSFGVESKNVTKTLEQLGDISGGNAARFQSLALVFGQVQAAQRLTGQDLLQFINAGWNPLLDISDATGESMATLRDRMSEGQISFQMIADAMRSATEEGGKFEGRMDALAGTLIGQQVIMEGNLSQLKTTVGGVLAPIKETGISLGNGLIKWVAQPLADGMESVMDTITFKSLRENMDSAGQGIDSVTEATEKLRQTTGDLARAQLELATEKADAPLIAELTKLEQRNLELKMGIEWVKEYNLLNSEGSETAKEQLLAARKLNEQLKSKKEDKDKSQREFERLQSAGEKLAESVRSPFSKLVDDLAELQLLFDVGAINAATAESELARIKEKSVESGAKPIKVELATSASRGSREEFAIIAKINQGQSLRDRKEEQRHNAAQEFRRATKVAAEKSNELLQDMINNETVSVS